MRELIESTLIKEQVLFDSIIIDLTKPEHLLSISIYKVRIT